MLRSNLNTINDRIFNKTAIRIDDQALREVEACYRFLEKFEQGKVIYGINTGFGSMAQYRIGDADLNSLQYNIIRSHSCGAGEALPDICVRAAMLARLVVENGYQVAAIEMLALVQAADYLQCAGELSDATRQLYADIRGIVPRFADDTPKHREIAAIENFLKNNSASL